MKKLADQYEASHKGVELKIDNLPPEEAYAALKKEAQLGQPHDVMLLPNEWLNEFAALGYLSTVDDLLTGDQQSQRIATSLNQVKWNGFLWGIPKDVDPYIIAWSKEKAAAWSKDHTPESTEELLAWIKQFHKPDGTGYGLYARTEDAYSLLSLVSATGIPADTTGSPLARLDEPGSIQQLQSLLLPDEKTWSAEAFERHYPAEGKGFQPWELLESGKLAAFLTTVSDYKLHGGDSVTISALPVTVTGKLSQMGTWLKGRSYALSSKAKTNQAAVAWLKEISSLDSEMKLWADGRRLPALIPAYTTSALRNDPSYKSYAWLVEQGRVLPVQIDAAKKLAALQADAAMLRQGKLDLKRFGETTAAQWKPQP
ncbi:hypothetical protein J31TS4_29340 [Paenibacillus sp. J31TS4]|nr:hypothetical protein J31TS4_29340 [Paenibacillus sp. J31TS4]